MPNWKKVVTSGSSAELQSINVSENVTITGSLHVSSSINTSTSELYSGSYVVLDWDLHQLKSNNIPSIEWDERKLYDASAEDSLDWHNRQLIGTDENVMLNWSGSSMHASASIYMSASTQLYGTASYALTASRSDASTVSVSSSITLQTDPGTYPLVYVTSTGNNPLHISPYGAVYNTANNSISNISSVSASGGFFGTASYALTASHALTASNIYGAIKNTSGTPDFLLSPSWSADYVMFSRGDGTLTADAIYKRTNLGTRDYVIGGNVLVTAGNTNNVSGSFYSLFIGSNHISTGSSGNNTLLGLGNYVSESNYQTIVGQYNNTNISQSGAFVVGSGYNSGNRRNLLVAYGDYFEVSASNIIAKGLVTSSTSNVLTYNTSTGQIYYTASSAIGSGGSGTTPNLQQVTDQGNTTTNNVIITGSLYVQTSIDSLNRQLINGDDEHVSVDWLGRYLVDQNGNQVVDWKNQQMYDTAISLSLDWNDRSLRDNNQLPVLYWSGSNQLILSASNLYAKGLTTGSTSDVLTFNPATGQVYYTASNAIGAAAVIPTLQQVTDQGNTTTNDVIITGSLYVQNRIDSNLAQLISNGETVIDWDNATLSDANYSPSLTSVDWVTRTLSDTTQNVTVDWQNYKLIDTTGQTSIYWEVRTLNDFFGTASLDWYTRTLKDENNNTRLYWATPNQLILSASNLYVKGITTGSTSNVLTFNPTTGQVYYTASSAIGGGGSGPESDPIFTAWSGSSISQFAGTSSFATTSSFTRTALTASFVTASNVFGPFGSNSIRSASYAVTASHVPGLMPGAPNYSIQFNDNNSFAGDTYFTFDPILSSLQFGNNAIASGQKAFAQGWDTEASGNYSHAEGYRTIALGGNSHAEGRSTTASAAYSHAEGLFTETKGLYSHAEGRDTIASGSYSHAEGYSTTAQGNHSHAEGITTTTYGDYSHAEGGFTKAYGTGAHSEGQYSIAYGDYSHAAGFYTSASGDYSYTGGGFTSASLRQTVVGLSNLPISSDGAFIVGSGDSSGISRSNLLVALPDSNQVHVTGSLRVTGDVYFPGLPVTASSPFVVINPSNGRLHYVGKKEAITSGLGTGTTAVGSDAIAGGKDTQANGDQGFSIGDTTIANGTNAVSTGKDTIAEGTSSLATGTATKADGNDSVATGKDTIAKGTASFASGKSTVASGSNSVATGRDTIASGSNSMTAGSGSKADAENSVAFGKGTIAKTDEQVVIGRYNTADTQSLFVVGAGTDDTNRKTIMKVDSVGARIDGSMTISGSSTFTNIGPAVFSGSIVQESTTATGNRSVALGFRTEASGEYALAYGYDTTALGDQSIAGGRNTVASGTYSVALGVNNYAAQNASLVFGAHCRTEGLYSIAAGAALTASEAYQFVVGKFNDTVTTQGAFIIGNGINSSNRSNLLVAGSNTVEITGSLNVNGNVIANSFTGSVQGTGSWAIQAVTASIATTSSFASTASFVNTLNQNVTISGSLNISGSILPSNRKLYYSDGTVSVDWEASETYDSHGNNKSIEWDNRILRDASGVTASIDWGSRRLHDSNGSRRLIWNTSGVQVSGSLNVTGSVIAPTFTGSLNGHVVTSSINTSQSVLINSFGTAVNWASSTLGYSNVTSVNWAGRILFNSSSNATVDWQSGILSDNSGNVSVNWIDRGLRDFNGVISVNYNGRVLHNNAGVDILNFSTKNKLTGYGAISTELNSAFFGATEDTASINYYAGEFYKAPYAVPGVTYGELLYLDHSTNEWVNIDQTTDSCTRYLGIDLKSKDGILTEGYILMTDNADPFHSSMPRIVNPLIGMPVYIKESANGDFRSYTCDIPTSGYVRVIGHVMYQSSVSGFETKYMIKFKPSNDWYEI